MRQLLALSLFSLSAFGAAVTPSCGSFGTLSGATFGGTGIPNDAVCITTFNDGAVVITLGLTATPHGALAPPVTNDGAGTFTAQAGPSVSPVNAAQSLWNFSYYISIVNNTSNAYVLSLLYDVDPALANDASTHGVISGAIGGNITVQDSQNLGFGFLYTLLAPVTQLPATLSFDPNAVGEYTFSLRIANFTAPTTILGQANILVNTVVPEPSTYGLAFIGLAAAAWTRRRQRHQPK